MPPEADWPFDDRADLTPPVYLGGLGRVFARFDARTQDSGNISFGVEAGERRWFVKTAGDPDDPKPYLNHADRVALLENAQRIARALDHPATPRLHGAVPSAWGPMLVYDWAPGELVRTPAERRDDPACSFQRFRRLPLAALEKAIDAVIEIHVQLCGQGWVACDFYDGCWMYDFQSGELHVFDLDSYHLGPFTNEMGRLFGSDRFMAPEEFEKGALIDERTTVFNLGRALAVFLGDGTLDRAAFRGSDVQHAVMLKACAPGPDHRFQSLAELARAWRV
jgi:serine/threonine protein kinase, bacterial